MSIRLCKSEIRSRIPLVIPCLPATRRIATTVPVISAYLLLLVFFLLVYPNPLTPNRPYLYPISNLILNISRYL